MSVHEDVKRNRNFNGTDSIKMPVKKTISFIYANKGGLSDEK